jgi:hypothetical protein
MVRELAYQVLLADSQVDPVELPKAAPESSAMTA